MNIQIRLITPDDTEACGRIIYEAFTGISARHNFSHDFPSAEAAAQMAQILIEGDGIYGIVAESEGRFIGSNFLHEQSEIRGVGPVSIDPQRQGKGVGRKLMEAVIERGRDAKGIRLVQDTFNTASFSLYARLGFEVKEPLAVIHGEAVRAEVPVDTDAHVRLMSEKDFTQCGELCRKVLGFNRAKEFEQLIQMFPAFVLIREGRVAAYASAPNFWQLNHSVAETDEDMQSLLAGACGASGQPLSFLLPTRQSSLLRWCLSKGMKVVKPMTLMTMGEYEEPRGCYLPSVLY